MWENKKIGSNLYLTFSPRHGRRVLSRHFTEDGDQRARDHRPQVPDLPRPAHACHAHQPAEQQSRPKHLRRGSDTILRPAGSAGAPATPRIRVQPRGGGQSGALSTTSAPVRQRLQLLGVVVAGWQHVAGHLLRHRDRRVGHQG